MKLLQASLQKWQSQDFFVRCLLILLVAVMFLGGLTRFYRLDEKGLWSDEIATIATSLGNSIDPDAYRLRHETFDASEPVPAAWYKQKAFDISRIQDLSSTANVLKANVHPPLFFTMMHVWLLNRKIGTEQHKKAHYHIVMPVCQTMNQNQRVKRIQIECQLRLRIIIGIQSTHTQPNQGCCQ